MSIATKLSELNTIKQDIKTALEEKGQTPSNVFSTYADDIRNIQVGGGENQLDSYIKGEITQINSNVTSVYQYAFYYQQNITSISLPQATNIGMNAFGYCTNLTSIYLPNVIELKGAYIFINCNKLSYIDLPNLTTTHSYCFSNYTGTGHINIPKVNILEENIFNYSTNIKSINASSSKTIKTQAFENCKLLDSVCLGNVNNIWNFVFDSCYSIKCIIFQSISRPTLSTDIFSTCYHLTGAVNSTYNPNGDKDGYIYVSDNLVESFKKGTYWSNYGDQIKGLSELPEEYKQLYGIGV